MATLGEAVLPMQVEPASKSSLQEFSAREVRYLIGWLGPFTLNPRDSRMRLYNNQHQFYCGVEPACQLPVRLRRRCGWKQTPAPELQVRDTKSLLAALKPFARGFGGGLRVYPSTGIGCATSAKPTNSRSLSSDCSLSQGHSAGKVKNDKIDSEKLAFCFEVVTSRCLRVSGAAGVAHAICSGRRSHLVRRRGETLTHISHRITNSICLLPRNCSTPATAKVLPTHSPMKPLDTLSKSILNCSKQRTTSSSEPKSILNGPSRFTMPTTSTCFQTIPVSDEFWR